MFRYVMASCGSMWLTETTEPSWGKRGLTPSAASSTIHWLRVRRPHPETSSTWTHSHAFPLQLPRDVFIFALKKNTIFFFNGTCLHSVLFRLNVLNAPYSYLLHLFKGLQLSTNCPLLFNEVYKCKSQVKSVIWETKKPKQLNKIKRKPKIHTWKWNPININCWFNYWCPHTKVRNKGQTVQKIQYASSLVLTFCLLKLHLLFP